MREDMVWNVYVEDTNRRDIAHYNIFNHYSFMEDAKNAYKDYKDDYEKFCDEIRRSLQQYFWSKCEWEVIISDWPPSKREPVEVKVDVYDQVMQNQDIFFKYTWDMCHARKNAKSVEIDFSEC